MIRVISLITLVFCNSLVIAATNRLNLSFTNSVPTYSFEQLHDKQTQLTASPHHYIEGKSSLRWDWVTDDDSLEISVPIVYKKQFRPKNSGMDVRSVFKIWIYSETIQAGALTFTFMKEGIEQCSADFQLGFKGWRLMSFPFDAMSGTPVKNMDSLTISVNSPKGTLFFDALMPSVQEDIRRSWHDSHQTFKRNTERGNKVQYLAINQPDFQRLSELPLTSSVTETLNSLKTKLRNKYGKRSRKADVNKALNYFNKLKIVKDSHGVRGRHLNGPTLLQPGEPLRNYFSNLLLTAQQYQATTVPDVKEQLKKAFILMIEHLLDQGWQEGSSMGASHHMGYVSRDLAPAILLMEQELKEAHLLNKSARLLFWIGRDFFDFTQAISAQPMAIQEALYQRSADYLLTFVNTHFIACLLLPNTELKSKILQNFSQSLSDIILQENGLIKNDGSLFHHHMHYLGYGLPAVDTVIGLVALLDGTEFEISQPCYNRLKMAVLNAENWCYPFTGPISTGRHPLIADRQSMLERMSYTLSNSVPQSVFCHLDLSMMSQRVGNDKTSGVPQLNGFWTMNYNAAGTYKYGKYSVQLKGYNSAVRSHETYKTDNRYGRYLGCGSLFVFDNSRSGYNYDGWDWSQIPGTTSLKLPLDTLEGGKGFYGWKPRQTANFSGSGHLDNKYGIFVFQTETGKGDQSISVNQSIFVYKKKLICLGSNLSSNSDQFPLVSTLFQRGTSDLGESILSSSEKINNLKHGGIESSLTRPIWLMDSIGIGYKVYPNTAAVLQVEKQLQHSLHDKQRTQTQGKFIKTSLDFGENVKNKKYEYEMILGATVDELNMEKAYNVICHDSNAHIVEIPQEKLKFYAIFNKESLELNDTLIFSVDQKLILLAKNQTNTLELSVTQPVIQKRGVFDPVVPETVEVTLNGLYQLTTPTAFVKLTQQVKHTKLEITLVDGKTAEFSLSNQ